MTFISDFLVILKHSLHDFLEIDIMFLDSCTNTILHSISYLLLHNIYDVLCISLLLHLPHSLPRTTEPLYRHLEKKRTPRLICVYSSISYPSRVIGVEQWLEGSGGGYWYYWMIECLPSKSPLSKLFPLFLFAESIVWRCSPTYDRRRSAIGVRSNLSLVVLGWNPPRRDVRFSVCS